MYLYTLFLLKRAIIVWLMHLYDHVWYIDTLIFEWNTKKNWAKNLMNTNVTARIRIDESREEEEEKKECGCYNRLVMPLISQFRSEITSLLAMNCMQVIFNILTTINCWKIILKKNVHRLSQVHESFKNVQMLKRWNVEMLKWRKMFDFSATSMAQKSIIC